MRDVYIEDKPDAQIPSLQPPGQVGEPYVARPEEIQLPEFETPGNDYN